MRAEPRARILAPRLEQAEFARHLDAVTSLEYLIQHREGRKPHSDPRVTPGAGVG